MEALQRKLGDKLLAVAVFMAANLLALTLTASFWGWIALPRIDGQHSLYSDLPALLPYFDFVALALCGLAHVSVAFWQRRSQATDLLRNTLRAATIWALAMPALLYLKPLLVYAAFPLPGLAYALAVAPSSAVIQPSLWNSVRALPAHSSAETIVAELGKPTRIWSSGRRQTWTYEWSIDEGFRITLLLVDGSLADKAAYFYVD